MKLLAILALCTGIARADVLFDGDDTCTNNVAINTGLAPVTMTCWFNMLNTNNTGVMLFFNGNTGANGYGLGISDGVCGAGLKACVVIGGLTCNFTTSAYTITTNEWHHIGMTQTFSSPNYTTILYVDGVQRSSVTTSSGPSAPSASMTAGKSFIGTIAECRFIGRAYTAGEMLNEYSKGRRNDSEQTGVAYYPFDDGYEGQNATTVSNIFNHIDSGGNPKFILKQGTNAAGATWKASSLLIYP